MNAISAPNYVAAATTPGIAAGLSVAVRGTIGPQPPQGAVEAAPPARLGPAMEQPDEKRVAAVENATRAPHLDPRHRFDRYA